jgi:hypothetical protein
LAETSRHVRSSVGNGLSRPPPACAVSLFGTSHDAAAPASAMTTKAEQPSARSSLKRP